MSDDSSEDYSNTPEGFPKTFQVGLKLVPEGGQLEPGTIYAIDWTEVGFSDGDFEFGIVGNWDTRGGAYFWTVSYAGGNAPVYVPKNVEIFRDEDE